MNFTQSIEHSITQSTNFDDRADRSEFWYFILLFAVVVGTCTGFGLLKDAGFAGLLNGMAVIAFALPFISLLVRRLHDTNRSGKLAWLLLVPGVGALILLYFCLQKGDQRRNRYGI